MLGLGLGSNKNVFNVSAAEARPAVTDEYVFTDNNLYDWNATGLSGELVANPDYAYYQDEEEDNVDHRIIKANSTSSSNLYAVDARPNDIYYKIRIFRGDISQNLTGIFRISAFGKVLTLDEADRELPFATEKIYTGVIQDVPYTSQYYYVDFHKDPSEYGQGSLTGGFMIIYSIQFASYDLSA